LKISSKVAKDLENLANMKIFISKWHKIDEKNEISRMTAPTLKRSFKTAKKLKNLSIKSAKNTKKMKIFFSKSPKIVK